jgi:hypothetical protein
MAADLAFLTRLHGPQHHAVPCAKTRYRSRTEEARGVEFRSPLPGCQDAQPYGDLRWSPFNISPPPGCTRMVKRTGIDVSCRTGRRHRQPLPAAREDHCLAQAPALRHDSQGCAPIPSFQRALIRHLGLSWARRGSTTRSLPADLGVHDAAPGWHCPGMGTGYAPRVSGPAG